MKCVCPKCQRPVLSRRHRHCQYCGAELPKEFLLSQEELEKENRTLEKMEIQRTQRQIESDAQEKLRQRSHYGII